jgi:hypothetical protein
MGNERRPRIENLELNKETLQELTESESEQAKGGAQHLTGTCQCRGAAGIDFARRPTNNPVAC